jgi:hypothetical protein
MPLPWPSGAPGKPKAGTRNSLIADPKFVDWQKDDFRLQPDSAAFKLGFEAIPVEKIGIRK